MPTATETGRSPRGSKNESFDAAKYVDGLKAELKPDQTHRSEISELDDDTYDALDAARTEATKDKEAAAESARAEINGVHGDLDARLRNSLEDAVYEKAIKAAEARAKANGEDVATAKELAEEELNDKKIGRLVDDADLDQVYARLKDLDSKALEDLLKEIAADLPEYKFDTPFINGAEVLGADLEGRFGDLAKKREAAHAAKKEVEGSFLDKRKKTTEQFIKARKGIDEARRDGKGTAEDITAMQDNIDGTYEATKEMNKLLHKGDLVGKSRFYDRETKTHIIELIYRVKDGEGSRARSKSDEVIVEHWNGSKEDGGELIRSTYVKTGKEKVKGGLQAKFWKGRKTTEQDANATKVGINLFAKYPYKLSPAAREQMSGLSSESIQASKRSEKTVDGLTGKKATKAKLNGRLMGTLGLPEKESKYASGLSKNRPRSFMEELTARLFSGSNKISKKH